MKLLYGIARKVAVPVLVQAIVGWVLFIVGFAVWHNDSALYEGLTLANDNIDRYEDTGAYPEHRASGDYAPYWIVAVAGPIVFINCFVHLFVGRWYTGLFAHFITAVYIVLAGGVVYRDARILFNEGIYDLLIGISYAGYFADISLEGSGTIPSVIADYVTPSIDPVTGAVGFDVNVSLEDYLTDEDLGLWVLIEWVGCTWSLLMMAIYVVMWPLFPDTTTDTIE